MAIEAPDYFQPEGGLVLTHLLIVRDVDRSRVLPAEAARQLEETTGFRLGFPADFIAQTSPGSSARSPSGSTPLTESC